MRACCGGGSSRPSLRIAKLSKRHSISNPREVAAVPSQRAVFHEYGHTGSNHIVTSVGCE